MNVIGLREAKREATAHALAWAAFDLTRERGLDGFTIDDVVERAGYSRRTFANHYAGKEEAIVAVAAEQVRHALDAVPDDDLPLVDWLQAVARQQLTSGLLVVLRELRGLAKVHPSLQPYLLRVQSDIREAARAAIITRVHGRAGRIYAHLLVGAAYGALTCVLDGHLKVRLDGQVDPSGIENADAPLTLDEFLAMTFNHLRSGFGRGPTDR